VGGALDLHLVAVTEHERAWHLSVVAGHQRRPTQAGDPHRHRQVSVGVLEGARLVAALGLILDGPHSAELGYWTT